MPDEQPTHITVTEAATRLNVTLPRLLRHLKRADFAPFTTTTQRKTRTGTRTVTLLDITVLGKVKRELREVRRPKIEQKHKQLQASETESANSLGDEEWKRAIVDQVAALQAHLADAVAERDRLIAERNRLYTRIDALEEECREATTALKRATEVPTAPKTGWLPWRKK